LIQILIREQLAAKEKAEAVAAKKAALPKSKWSEEMESILSRSGIVTEFIILEGAGPCDSCGLSRTAAGKLMKVPGLAGLFCSILCVEQGIAESGCRWCGAKAEASKYCSDEHRDLALENPIGNGRRLVSRLRAQKNSVAEGRVCEVCNTPISLVRRADSTTCSRVCRDALNKRRERQKPAILTLRTQDLKCDIGIPKGIVLATGKCDISAL
jgi:predicted nucleic acid-binding Zn ribbon protein